MAVEAKSHWGLLALLALVLLGWRWLRKQKTTAAPVATVAPPPAVDSTHVEIPAVHTPTIVDVTTSEPTPVVTPNPGTSGSSLTMAGYQRGAVDDSAINGLSEETQAYLDSQPYFGYGGGPVTLWSAWTMEQPNGSKKEDVRAAIKAALIAHYPYFAAAYA